MPRVKASFADDELFTPETKRKTKRFLSETVTHLAKETITQTLALVGLVDTFVRRFVLRGVQRAFAFFLIGTSFVFFLLAALFALREVLGLPWWASCAAVGMTTFLVGFIVYAWSKR